MKLRFRKNSLRLRVNQREVEMLAAGKTLQERVAFAGGATLDYVLSVNADTSAEFDGKAVHVTAPLSEWARGGDIGFYFGVEPDLKVAIEKDLECVDGPEDEKDPDAFSRNA